MSNTLDLLYSLFDLSKLKKKYNTIINKLSYKNRTEDHIINSNDVNLEDDSVERTILEDYSNNKFIVLDTEFKYSLSETIIKDEIPVESIIKNDIPQESIVKNDIPIKSTINNNIQIEPIIKNYADAKFKYKYSLSDPIIKNYIPTKTIIKNDSSEKPIMKYYSHDEFIESDEKLINIEPNNNFKYTIQGFNCNDEEEYYVCQSFRYNNEFYLINKNLTKCTCKSYEFCKETIKTCKHLNFCIELKNNNENILIKMEKNTILNEWIEIHNKDTHFNMIY
jgi:hypothetical protein